jgi:hypothetical protein
VFLYCVFPFLLKRRFLSFACFLSVCFGFHSSFLYCILTFCRVEFFSALLLRPVFYAFITLHLSSLDLSLNKYTVPSCANLHISVATLRVHGWLQQNGLLPSCLRTDGGELPYSVVSVCAAPSSNHLHTCHTRLRVHCCYTSPQPCYTYCPWMGRFVLYHIERGWSLERGRGGRLHVVTKSLTTLLSY